MENYPRKSLYRDKAVAKSYFEKRFSSRKGKREDAETGSALERALDWIPTKGRVLDLPCGSGRFTRRFSEKGYVYFGADISMEMMEVLIREKKGQAKGPPLIQCDVEHLPFRDGTFDCVACIRFLNLVPFSVRERILKEMRRVSKGWLIVQSHRLRPIGPLVSLKVFAKRLFGADVAKYRFREGIIQAGWKEEKRIRIRHKRQYIGIYQRTV